MPFDVTEKWVYDLRMPFHVVLNPELRKKTITSIDIKLSTSSSALERDLLMAQNHGIPNTFVRPRCVHEHVYPLGRNQVGANVLSISIDIWR